MIFEKDIECAIVLKGCVVVVLSVLVFALSFFPVSTLSPYAHVLPFLPCPPSPFLPPLSSSTYFQLFFQSSLLDWPNLGLPFAFSSTCQD